jgi:hypothetical protein
MQYNNNTNLEQILTMLLLERVHLFGVLMARPITIGAAAIVSSGNTITFPAVWP